MKKCLFCAEEIQEAAIKCRYCGTMLDQPTTPATAATPVSQPTTAPVADGWYPGKAITEATAPAVSDGWYPGKADPSTPRDSTKKKGRFKVCAACGKEVRVVDDSCWNCKSTTFRSNLVDGTPGSVAEMNQTTTADLRKWGKVNPEIVCPQCQTKGRVHALPTKRKAGISGAKATGAVLTLGWSLLATGLSRKQQVTQAHCDNCDSTWDF